MTESTEIEAVEKPNRLRTLLNKRYVRLALAGVLGYTASQTLPEQITRPLSTPTSYALVHFNAAVSTKHTDLTAGEAVMVRALFGEDFRTDNIRKTYQETNRYLCFNRRATACVIGPTNHVQFVNPEYFIDDYSRDGSISGRRTQMFMHEMTHIWQFRQPVGTIDYCRNYRLPEAELMDTSRTFDDYCNEQQGEIIGHYAAFFLRPSGMGVVLMQDPSIAPRFERIRQIVEARFPRAAAVRVEMMRRADNHMTCSDQAGNNETALSNCNTRYYRSIANTPLTTDAYQVTFTLPNGTVRYPSIEAARRNGEVIPPAPRATARPTS